MDGGEAEVKIFEGYVGVSCAGVCHVTRTDTD